MTLLLQDEVCRMDKQKETNDANMTAVNDRNSKLFLTIYVLSRLCYDTLSA